MPIVGLSDQKPRFERLGKIKMGVKRPDTGAPQAVRYFVLPTDEDVANGKARADAVKAMRDQFGPEPTELPIYIPCENIELWAPQYLKRYSKTRGLTCKGTGKGPVLMRLVDTDTGDFANRNTKEGHTTIVHNVQCDKETCPEYIEGRCKEVMCLQFILPTIPGLGVWQIDTSSSNSIKNINSQDYLIKYFYDRISGIPLILTTEPHVVQTPEGRQRTVYVLHIRTTATMNQLLQYMTSRAKLLEAGRSAIAQIEGLPAPEEAEIPELLFPDGGEEPEEAPPTEPPESDEPFPAESATSKAPPQDKKAPPATTQPSEPTPTTAPPADDELKKLRQKVAMAWSKKTGKNADDRKAWMRKVYQTDTLSALSKEQLDDMYKRLQSINTETKDTKTETAPTPSETKATKEESKATPGETKPAQGELKAPVQGVQGSRAWGEMSKEEVEAAVKELGYDDLQEQTKYRSELFQRLNDLGYTTDDEKRKYLEELNVPPTRDMTRAQIFSVVEGVKKAISAMKEAETIPDF